MFSNSYYCESEKTLFAFAILWISSHFRTAFPIPLNASIILFFKDVVLMKRVISALINQRKAIMLYVKQLTLLNTF